MVVALVLAVLAAVVVAAELMARGALGLGDPPLWQADPEIEYLPQPSRSYRRFGNRVTYNAWSMRSREFPRTRSDPREARVLVVGDSIVNGGAAVDQDALATALLEQRLAADLGRPVVVGNVACESWGPPNYLAYLRRYGFFDADVVVIVVNSADYADAPTFEPLPRWRPQRKPLLALQEVADKYLPRYLRRLGRRAGGQAPPAPEAIESCLEALRGLVELGRSAGAEVLLAQHLTRRELDGGPHPGHGQIMRVAREAGIEPHQLGPAFAAAIAGGVDPFLDGEHPNTGGQRILFEQLLPAVRAALQDA
jgi:hypothetical protein